MTSAVFSIPPGVPFLATFAQALLDGKIIPSISRAAPPLALAQLTIYVPTQRAARALAVEIAQALQAPAALLPRILALGGLEAQETAALLHGGVDGGDLALAPAIDELERRLVLARLSMQWAKALRHAILEVDPSGEPVVDAREQLLVAPSPVNAYALARDLSALIDEFIIEDVDRDALSRLEHGAFDRFWAITTHFLEIALRQWPAILAERGLADAAARQKTLIDAQIARLSEGGDDAPVIALGSTGANPATARLLRAIARFPAGAVVLPGLDREMSEAAFALIGDADASRQEPAFTHPQTMLKRLLAAMETPRAAVIELGAPTLAQRARRALLSQALLPAEATEGWRDFRAVEGATFAEALSRVAYLEAPDERMEASALALLMREALETPGRTTALITPDRTIARRVAAELTRYGVEIDDSGGQPLSTSELGVLARLIGEIAADGGIAEAIVALLAHPLATFGLPRAEVTRLAALVDIGVLRAVALDAGERWASALDDARVAAGDRHAPLLARAASDEDWRDAGDLLARIDAALAPLLDLPRGAELRARVEAHRVALGAVMATAEESAPCDGAEELFALFDALATNNAPLGFTPENYVAFFGNLLLETTLRTPRRTHPRVKILGPLEARLIHADLMLIAGLDETVWPPQTDAGAFLNRAMRRQLGLTPPERRIGQSAHDFVMAFGAEDIVLSRALKRDGSPTVASRFVTRLAALAADAFSACKTRGARALDIAAALDAPGHKKSLSRPEPTPPLDLRPQRLSVTRIETLRRDPYSIYAETILRLSRLPPLGGESGARAIGVALHEALANFAEDPGAAEDAREIMLALARARLSHFFGDPAFCLFDWPRVVAGLEFALAFDAERRAGAAKIFVEEAGDWRFTLCDGSPFALGGVADRIEIDASGEAVVFDYKTGTPPTLAQVNAGFAPQLTLEAAMLEAGAFAAVGKRRAAGAAYVQIGAANAAQWLKAKDKEKDFGALVAEHREQLFALLNQFRSPSRSYPSRPFVAFASRFGDYDHLARVKEWSRGGEGEE
jgi:ATP-dependent helicase/nuclease subunit B